MKSIHAITHLTPDDAAAELAANHRRTVVMLALTALALIALADVCAIVMHANATRYTLPMSIVAATGVLALTIANLMRTRHIVRRFRADRFLTAALSLRS